MFGRREKGVRSCEVSGMGIGELFGEWLGDKRVVLSRMRGCSGEERNE